MSRVREDFLKYEIPVWDGLLNNITQKVRGCGVRHETCSDGVYIRINQWMPCISDRLGNIRMYRSFMTHALSSNQLRESRKAMALQRGPP